MSWFHIKAACCCRTSFYHTPSWLEHGKNSGAMLGSNGIFYCITGEPFLKSWEVSWGLKAPEPSQKPPSPAHRDHLTKPVLGFPWPRGACPISFLVMLRASIQILLFWSQRANNQRNPPLCTRRQKTLRRWGGGCQKSSGGLYSGTSQWNGMTRGIQESLPLAIPSGTGRSLTYSLLSFLPVSSWVVMNETIWTYII